jgi:transcription termination factor Rho
MGFGFLRSVQRKTICPVLMTSISPFSQVRRFGQRTGDIIEGEIRAPKESERYFALLKVNSINGEPPERIRHRINFDNLTPLYPDRKINLELDGSDQKGSSPSA